MLRPHHLFNKPSRLYYLGVFCCLLAFAACGKAERTPTASPATLGAVSATLHTTPEAITPPPPASPVPTLTPAAVTLLATQVVEPGEAFTNPGENLQTAPTPAPDPLRFVFPEAGPAPVSAWRPPLYPTPWAPSPYDHFYFARPIAANEVNWPLWDYRYGGSFFADVIHTGVDIPAPKGTPVLAAGSGKVIHAGYGIYRGYNDPKDPYGLAVVIFHDFGYQGQSLYSVYGHLDQVDVIEGQYVTVSQHLGLVGETGRVTGPHLHFEVRLGKNDYFTTRNPELWLVPPQGWGVLAGRLTDSLGNPLAAQNVIVQSVSSGQNWLAKSYGLGAVNSDPYYDENLVIGDLPAGIYEIRIPYVGINYKAEMQIFPGMVNYFVFRGRDGVIVMQPDFPGGEFTPPGAGESAQKP